MIGMHLAKLTRGLYFAVNKNDDEIYTERIEYNFNEASALMSTARGIIEAKTPPPKFSEDASKFPCMFCSHKDRCHGNANGPAVPCVVTCRNCCHATPVVLDDDNAPGEWRCEKHKKTLSDVEQARACVDHIFIPDLVTFATVVDSDGDLIVYRNADGRTWGNGPGAYLSTELTSAPASMIGSKVVDAVKDKLGGTVYDPVFAESVYAEMRGKK